jgi:hypothetical protein
MNVYSIDVRVYATAYIKANSAEEALEIAKGLKDSALEVDDAGSDVEISGAMLDDPDLPDVSLSPAMTVVGPDDGDEPSLAEGE